jgi:chromosomal replication initiation ATPase DnaA
LAEEYVARCASCLGVEFSELVSGSRRQDVVQSRRLIVTLGRERWNQRTKDLALTLRKSADTVTYIQREGIRQRLEVDAFRLRFEDLDRQLAEMED